MKAETEKNEHRGNVRHHEKKLNLCITRIDEKEESQANGIDKIFNKIMNETSPN